MLHPALESVSNFVWRMAVPRPWPAERVQPEHGDSVEDRARIARNNARAAVVTAAQASSLPVLFPRILNVHARRLWQWRRSRPFMYQLLLTWAGSLEFFHFWEIFERFGQLLPLRESWAYLR